MSSEVLHKIKSKGYWRIVIESNTYRKDRLVLSKCRSILEKSEVRKRGWPYPYIFQRDDATGSEFISNDFYENTIDWRMHLETWRMFKSEQFVHYSALREDWDDQIILQFGEQKVLGIITTLYSITEVFLFLSNLGTTSMYDDGALVQLELHNVYDRMLVFFNSPYRGFRELHDTYKCKMEEPIKVEKNLKKQDVVSSGQSIAMEVAEEVFEKFNWTSQIREILRDDQDQFIRGLI